jgi:quercetin dioxygenase-like cupin family protein
MKYSSADLFFKERMDWIEIEPGIERQILGYNDEIMMVKVMFNKNKIGKIHSHPHSQATYVSKGLFKVSIGEDEKMLESGDSFFVPPNVKHGVLCLEEGILVDTFSPVRKDFFS